MGNTCFGKKESPAEIEIRRRKQLAGIPAIKLVLIGTGESGKTTIWKQFQCIYGNGLKEQTRKQMGPQILFNVLEGTAHLIERRNEEGIPLESQEERDAASLVVRTKQRLLNSTQCTMDQPLVDAILTLRRSNAFQQILNNKAKLQLADGWELYVKKLERFPAWGGGEEWVPSEDDVLRARIRTIGLQECRLKIGDLKYDITDIGGQMSERRKWQTRLDGVQGLLFVASMSDYDQVAFENNNLNRLTDSISEWCNYCNRSEFSKTAIVLFLNKRDLLEVKFCDDNVPIVPEEEVEAHAPPPKYNPKKAKAYNLKNAINWFHDLYLSKVQFERRPSVFIYDTVALDANNIRKVTSAIHAQMILNIMKETGVTHMT